MRSVAVSTKHTFLNDYSSLVLRSSTADVLDHFAQKDVVLHHNMALDTTLMHNSTWESLVFAPKEQTPWDTFLRAYYDADTYKDLNRRVHSNPVLAKLATMNFIDSLGVAVKKRSHASTGSTGGTTKADITSFFNNPNQSQPPQPQNQPQQPQSQQQGPQMNPTTIEALLNAVVNAADESLQMADTADGFTHMGIPIEQYSIDEIREVLSSSIVVNLLRVYRKLRSQPSGKNHNMPSVRRGIPIGEKLMRSLSEAPDVVTSEMAYPDEIQSYHLATRTAFVRERYSGVNEVVVYLDKSGSMGGTMAYEGQSVEKIAYSAACAFALSRELKSVGSKLTLKLFDTMVHGEITKPFDLLKTLTSIRADGGTNITKVLEDALNYDDKKVVLVSDGIDSIDEATASRASHLDFRCVLIGTSNDVLEKYFKVQHVDKLSKNFLMEI